VAGQEKDRIKKEKDEKEAKYKVAYVDGRCEPVRMCQDDPRDHVRGAVR
jgi:DNA topoisomerase-1